MTAYQVIFFEKANGEVPAEDFIKKTQKTPKSEIDKAKGFRKEYMKREEG
jgi:phage-related protein